MNDKLLTYLYNLYIKQFLKNITIFWRKTMRTASSLKTLKKRDKNCRIVRRKGRVLVINKTNPRFKARQG